MHKYPCFFRCEIDGTIVQLLDGCGSLHCCGEVMKELTPNTSDGAQEKHVPQINIYGDQLVAEVGSTHHPMTQEHNISWIYLQTQKGGQIRFLSPDCPPTASFHLCREDPPVAVYSYCNLHGLWKADVVVPEG